MYRQPHFDIGSGLAIAIAVALVVLLVWLLLGIQFGSSALLMTI